MVKVSIKSYLPLERYDKLQTAFGYIFWSEFTKYHFWVQIMSFHFCLNAHCSTLPSNHQRTQTHFIDTLKRCGIPKIVHSRWRFSNKIQLSYRKWGYRVSPFQTIKPTKLYKWFLKVKLISEPNRSCGRFRFVNLKFRLRNFDSILSKCWVEFYRYKENCVIFSIVFTYKMKNIVYFKISVSISIFCLYFCIG